MVIAMSEQVNTDLRIAVSPNPAVASIFIRGLDDLGISIYQSASWIEPEVALVGFIHYARGKENFI